MNPATLIAAVAAVLALIFIADAALASHARRRNRIHLNLKAGATTMLNTEKLPFSIAPTLDVKDGNGNVVSSTPAPVTEIVWSCDPAVGSVNTSTPDNLNAVFTPVAGYVGNATVTCAAKSAAGDALSQSDTVPVTAPFPNANNLNLTAGTPVAA